MKKQVMMTIVSRHLNPNRQVTVHDSKKDAIQDLRALFGPASRAYPGDKAFLAAVQDQDVTVKFTDV
jgi:hypothetical protein